MTGHPFEYAVLQVVPRPERGERFNAGVLLYCQALDFLGALTHLDSRRLHALDPHADVAAVQAALDAAADVCRGDRAAGAAGREAPGRRFRWLVAPRSTVVQPGPVHTGITADPAAELRRLLEVLVLPLR